MDVTTTKRLIAMTATAALAWLMAPAIASSPAVAAEENGYVFNDAWELIDPGSARTEYTQPASQDATNTARTSVPLRTGTVAVDVEFSPGGAQLPGTNYLTAPSTHEVYGGSSSNFLGDPTSGNLPTVSLETNASYCGGALGTAGHQSFSGVCADSGTLTFRFDRTVTDPILDLSGVGGWLYAYNNGYGRGSFLSQQWVLTTPDVTMDGPLGNTPTNLAVDGTTLRADQTNTSARCDRTDKEQSGTPFESPDTVVAGCGSVLLRGSVTEISFRIDTVVTPWSRFPAGTHNTGSAYFAQDSSGYADGVNGLNTVYGERARLPGDIRSSQSDGVGLSIRLQQNGALGDLVWSDTNRDGIQDPDEPGIAGVTVSLLDADGTPVTDGDGNPITTTTDDGGVYRFADLPLGDYRVQFEQVPGHTFTQPGAGADRERDSDADPDTGMSDVVGLTTAAPVRMDIDAGLIELVPDFTFTKTAEPESGTTVYPGDTVTYTLTGSNTGDLPLNPVRVTDDLSEVLDDAEVTDGPTADIDGEPTTPPMLEDGTLTWEGTLRPGEVVTITMTVTVTDDATGHHRASGSGDLVDQNRKPRR